MDALADARRPARSGPDRPMPPRPGRRSSGRTVRSARTAFRPARPVRGRRARSAGEARQGSRRPATDGTAGSRAGSDELPQLHPRGRPPGRCRQPRPRLGHRRAGRAAGPGRVLDQRRPTRSSWTRCRSARSATPCGSASRREPSGTPTPHLRLGVPPDLEYVIKVGLGRRLGRAPTSAGRRIVSGSGDISVGRARDLVATDRVGRHLGGRARAGRRRGWRPGPATSRSARPPARCTAKSGSGEVAVKRCGPHHVQASSGSGRHHGRLDQRLGRPAHRVRLAHGRGRRRAAGLARPGLGLRRGPDRAGVHPPAAAG